jgi:hypothetical protein
MPNSVAMNNTRCCRLESNDNIPIEKGKENKGDIMQPTQTILIDHSELRDITASHTQPSTSHNRLLSRPRSS